MRVIAFDGGSVLWELGFPSDVLAFFKCIKCYAYERNSAQEYDLITDRLFRRFLRLEDLEPATMLMIRIREQFSTINGVDVDWKSIGVEIENTKLDIHKATLADVFARVFTGFSNCVESARSFLKDWQIYQPIRIVIANQPWFVLERQRVLEEYETLEGQPFWLR